MRRTHWVVLVALALGAFLGALAREPQQPDGTASVPRASEALVVRVVDGDTIKVELGGGRRETVRYIGVDTPESVKPGTPVQCFAHAASTANERLVAGERVRLTIDVEPRDRYGRLLAYVRRARDGVFVNEALVRGGYARTLTIPPNDRFADRFATLQKAAQKAGRGLWRLCRTR